MWLTMPISVASSAMRMTSCTDARDADVVVPFVADVAGVEPAGLGGDLRELDDFFGLREAAGHVEQPARQPERAFAPCRGGRASSSSRARRRSARDARRPSRRCARSHGRSAARRSGRAAPPRAPRAARRDRPARRRRDWRRSSSRLARAAAAPDAAPGSRSPSPACECTSMNPGATRRSRASIVRAAVAAASAPTAAMRSPVMPMSARSHGLPVPSMTRRVANQNIESAAFARLWRANGRLRRLNHERCADRDDESPNESLHETAL